MKTAEIVMKAPRPQGSKTPVIVTLHWRDENYGRLSGVLAFRPQIEPFPSEVMAGRILRICIAHGFDFNDQRSAMIAKNPTRATPTELVRELEEEGFTVCQAGCLPVGVVGRPSDAALIALRDRFAEVARDIEEASLWGTIETMPLDLLRDAAAGCDDDDLDAQGNRIINAALALAWWRDQSGE
jgi:hypothetical protein